LLQNNFQVNRDSIKHIINPYLFQLYPKGKPAKCINDNRIILRLISGVDDEEEEDDNAVVKLGIEDICDHPSASTLWYNPNGEKRKDLLSKLKKEKEGKETGSDNKEEEDEKESEEQPRGKKRKNHPTRR